MILRVLASFVACAAFAVIFSVPARIIPWASSIAASGWLIYETTLETFGITFSVFLSALLVGLISSAVALLKKWPIQPLVVVGIIPLVPGAPAFYAMQSFMSEDLFGAFEYSYITFFSASGIVIGLIASSTVFTLLERVFKISERG